MVAETQVCRGCNSPISGAPIRALMALLPVEREVFCSKDCYEGFINSQGFDDSYVLDKVDLAVQSLGISMPAADVDYSKMSDHELAVELAHYGANLGFLETQLAYANSAKVGVTEVLEKAIYSRLSRAQAAAEGRTLKDALVADVISADPRLRRMSRLQTEINAQVTALQGIRDSFDIRWRTISRLLSARSDENFKTSQSK